MAAATGQELAETIRKRMEEMVKACEGVNEGIASGAPEGRWSPKEIISHIMGPEEPGLVSELRAFLDEDTPTIELEAENPFFSEKRALMTFDQLLSEFVRVYGEISDLAAGLSPEQLDRKAHIPALKETDMGEYPTLEAMIGGLLDYHLQFHTEHMREVLEALRGR